MRRQLGGVRTAVEGAKKSGGWTLHAENPMHSNVRWLAAPAWALALMLASPPVRADDVSESTLSDKITDALEKSDPSRKWKDITWSDWRTGWEPSGGPTAGWSPMVLQTPGEKVWGQSLFVGADPSCQDGPSCDASLHLLKCTPGGSECAESRGSCQRMTSAVSVPGTEAPYLCAGPADSILEVLYQLITSATSTVDIVSLSAPDGRFRDMLRNALTWLARSKRAVTVRILISDYSGARINGTFSLIDVKQLLEDILTEANKAPDADNKLVVIAGRLKVLKGGEIDGWPHAKVIAVDGREAVIGGENLWTNTYLSWSPVWDLNVHVNGRIAQDATHFLDASWKYLCDHKQNLDHTSRRYVRSYDAAKNQPDAPLKLESECIKGLNIPTPELRGGVKMMGVGKLGSLDLDADQSLVAQEALIRAAHRAVYLSQQDLKGIVGMGYSDQIMTALADQLVAGRDVYLVKSADGAGKGSTEPYSNGTLENTAKKMKDYVKKARGAPSDSKKLEDLLCKRFHLAPMRFNDISATYGDTHPPKPIPNHAKFIMADTTAFYVGSHNLYPSGNNMEYGLIVDHHSAALGMYTVYWDKLWKYAKLSAISGDDAPSCFYRKPDDKK